MFNLATNAIKFLVDAETEALPIAPFTAVVDLLEQFGFFKVVLPFLLIFAVFWAILLKTKVLGDPATAPQSRGIAAVVALVAGFLVIAYTPVVDALAILIPQVAFLLIVVMLFLMLMAFIIPNWTATMEGNSITWWWIPGIIFMIILIAIVGGAVGEDIPVLGQFTKFLVGTPVAEAAGVGGGGSGGGSGGGGFALDPETLSLLIGVGIIVGIPLLVVVLLLKSSGGGGSGGGGNAPAVNVSGTPPRS